MYGDVVARVVIDGGGGGGVNCARAECRVALDDFGCVEVTSAARETTRRIRIVQLDECTHIKEE